MHRPWECLGRQLCSTGSRDGHLQPQNMAHASSSTVGSRVLQATAAGTAKKCSAGRHMHACSIQYTCLYQNQGCWQCIWPMCLPCWLLNEISFIGPTARDTSPYVQSLTKRHSCHAAACSAALHCLSHATGHERVGPVSRRVGCMCSFSSSHVVF